MKKLFVGKRGVVLGLVAALAITAAAIAYWTQGGSGTGSAATGTTSVVTVNQTSTISGLYPGGPAVTLSGNFDNPNASKVKVGAVTASVSGTNKPGCTADDFEIGGTAVVDDEVDPGAAKGSWSGLTIKMLNRAQNQDACKNATVDLAYSVTPAS